MKNIEPIKNLSTLYRLLHRFIALRKPLNHDFPIDFTAMNIMGEKVTKETYIDGIELLFKWWVKD